MEKIFILLAGLALVGCAGPDLPPPAVIAQNPLSITIQGPKVLDEGTNIIRRNQYLAGMAQSHCQAMAKNAVLTMADSSAPWSVVQTFECR